MKYYKHLYLSEGLEKKKDKIIQKIEAGKILPGIFLVTLAPDEKNQLEIHRYLLLLQPVFHRENLFVVGISKDYEEALELVEEITQEVYKDVYKRQDVETVLKKALKNMMF